MTDTYGLIFDVDGVIADTEAVNARASIKMFADLFGLRGVKRQDFSAGLGRGAREYVLAAARVHHLELSDEQIVRATQARQDNFLQILQDQGTKVSVFVLVVVVAGWKWIELLVD